MCGNEPVKGLPYCETRASHMRFLNRLEKLEAKAIAHVNEANYQATQLQGIAPNRSLQLTAPAIV